MKQKKMGSFELARIEQEHLEVWRKVKYFCKKHKVGITTFLESIGLYYQPFERYIKTNTLPLYYYIEVHAAMGYEVSIKRTGKPVPYLTQPKYVDAMILKRKQKAHITAIHKYGKPAKSYNRTRVRKPRKLIQKPDEFFRRHSHKSDEGNFLAAH